MELLQWKPSFALGLPAVDQEHLQMIDKINSIYQTLDNEFDGSRVSEVLAEIHAEIAAHFALEERIMQQAAYAEFHAHKADHEDLLDQIRDMMDSFSIDPEHGREMLRGRLNSWFSRHFSSFDARLHALLPHA